MYISSTLGTNDNDKANIHCEVLDRGNIFVRITFNKTVDDFNLFLTPEIADDLAWRLQTAVRHYESNASGDV